MADEGNNDQPSPRPDKTSHATKHAHQTELTQTEQDVHDFLETFDPGSSSTTFSDQIQAIAASESQPDVTTADKGVSPRSDSSSLQDSPNTSENLGSNSEETSTHSTAKETDKRTDREVYVKKQTV